jgi:putative ABC transport system permease protein
MSRRLRRTFLAPVRLARKRLWADPLFALALFLATAATAFLFALAPQVFDRLAANSLERSVAGAAPAERDLEISGAGRIDAASGEDPVASVLDAGREFERELPAAVRDVTGDGRAALETVRYEIVPPPGETGPPGTVRYLTLRYVEDAGEHLSAVEGALPADTSEPAELPFPDQSSATRVEVALSPTTANQLSLRPGDTVYLLPATDDPLARTVPVSERRYLAATVSGLVDGGPGDEAWIEGSRLGRAATRDTETARFVYGYGLVAPEAYNDLLAGTDPLPLRYEWQHAVDPDAVAASDTGQLASDLRQIDAVLGATTFGQRVGFGARTGLTRILERAEADRRAAAAALAVAGIALLSVALTVLGVLGALAAERRAESISVLRSRGATLAETLTTQAVEGLLVAVPAGALGFVVATLVSGRSPSTLSALLVLGVVLVVGALLAALAAGPARRALAVRDRADAVVPRLSPLRLAVEALVVVGSLAGAYLLRRRGLSATEGFDPFLAAVPVLIGLAVALLALRLFPIPLQGLAWASETRRDLVPTLGLRRLARQPSLAAAPFIVALLATSAGAFTATLAATLADAQDGLPAGALTSLNTDTVTVFRAGIAVAGAYAALALVLAPVLTARDRMRDFSYLRALGLSKRDLLRLSVIELGPPVAAALVTGVLLGVGLAYLVEPGLDLAALAGGEQVDPRPALLAPVLLIAVLVLVTVAVTALVAAAAGRVNLSRALRMGER